MPAVPEHGVLPGLDDDDHLKYWADTTIGTRATNYITTGTLGSGALTVSDGDIVIRNRTLDAAAILDLDAHAGRVSQIKFIENGLTNWVIRTDAGSDFTIRRFDDSGDPCDVPLTIDGTTGNVTLLADLSAANITAGTDIEAGVDLIANRNLDVRGFEIFLGNVGVDDDVTMWFRSLGSTGNIVYDNSDDEWDFSGGITIADDSNLTLGGTGNIALGSGNISGSDLDITAGTGDYSSTGNLAVGDLNDGNIDEEIHIHAADPFLKIEHAAYNWKIGMDSVSNLLKFYADTTATLLLSNTGSFTVVGTNANLSVDSSNNATFKLDRGGVNRRSEVKYETNDALNWVHGVADSDDFGDGTEFFIGQSLGGANPTITITTAGVTSIGTPGTNEMQVSGTGDIIFVGTAGLIFGHIYIPSQGGNDITVSLDSTDPCEVKDDGTVSENDGWAVGELNEVTFPSGGDEHYLTVPKIGRYEVAWNLSGHTAIGGGTVMHGGVMVNNVAIRNNGEDHATVSNSTDVLAVGGVAVVDITDLTGTNAQISLWISDDNSTDIVIEHGNMYIQLIGGT